ncbi:hypothetical protein HAX54_046644, partial [Datura stramonium]|nr:hypothetical protein [Datura stramonium]
NSENREHRSSVRWRSPMSGERVNHEGIVKEVKDGEISIMVLLEDTTLGFKIDRL